MNLVSGQRSYSFLADEDGNLILDIFRVFVLPSATDTIYQEITPVDKQSDAYSSGLWDESNNTGVPTIYDKTANGIFLDPIPDYNATGGLKMEINREASYFTYTDTTKKAGIPSIFHSWFYKKPALEYAKRNGNQYLVKYLSDDVQKLEKDIAEYFSMREKDKRFIMTPKKTLYI